MTGAIRVETAMDLRHVAIHGHRLAYRTAGKGPVVLLVHGMASGYPQCDAPERFGAVLADFIASTAPTHLQSWREVLHAPDAWRQRAALGVGS